MKQQRSFAFSLISAAIAGAFLMSCKPNSGGSEVREIIGTDNRAEIKDERILSRLGLLDVGDHKCNAVLVAPDTIATVVHCLDSKKLGTVAELTFTTAEGKSALVKQLLTIDKKKDLALYRLDKGGFNFFAPKLESNIAESIVVAGYDTTKNRWMQASCEIKEKSSEFASFTYDCDTVPGMSGSAIISNDRVIGLHVAYDKQLNQNLALDFSTVSNPSAEIAKRPRMNLEWPPCICCHGCDGPKLEMNKDVQVCGAKFAVSYLVYDACVAACATAAACTAATEGACSPSIGFAAGICGASVYTIQSAWNTCFQKH